MARVSDLFLTKIIFGGEGGRGMELVNLFYYKSKFKISIWRRGGGGGGGQLE